MQGLVNKFLGLALVAVVALFAYTLGSGPDTPETGGLTPLAPQEMQGPDLSNEDLFIDDEPVTPFPGSGDEAAIEDGVDAGSGMAVPGFEGDVAETIVEVSVGTPMVVPGFEGEISDMVVESGD